MDEKDILVIANKLVKKYGLNKKTYNVFSEFKMKENDHTKLLLSIWRYTDTKKQYIVLHSFLSRFTKGSIHINNRSKNLKILFSPKYGKDSFIDGLILWENSGKKTAVIIENKIFNAPDRQNQIRKYITHVKNCEKVSLENIWLFYITGDGGKEIENRSYNPDEEQAETNIGNRFIQITFKEDILNWLKEDILLPHIYPETLTTACRNYVDYLENHLFNSYVCDKNCLNYICKLLFKHTAELNKFEGKDFIKLYEVRNYIIKIIRNSYEKKCTENQTVIAIEFFYRTLSQLTDYMEKESVGRLEELSIRVLNEWNKKNSKQKTLAWKSRHRGLTTSRGFIQFGLTDEWGTKHLEWIPISINKMCVEKNYIIELHIEDDEQQAKIFRNEISKAGKNVSGGIILKSKSRVFRYKFTLNYPIALFKDIELEEQLKKIYTEDLEHILKVLVDKS